MFTTSLTEIITLKTLKAAYAQVSRRSVGLDRVSVELFEEDLGANLARIVRQVDVCRRDRLVKCPGG